ncbi:MAG: LamG-like jellyroll fold domain-containing protein [Promethearchaeota archaeon]
MKKNKLIVLYIIYLFLVSTININYQQISYTESPIVSENDDLAIKSPSVSLIDAKVHINASDIIRQLPANIYGTNINFINNGSGILNPNSLEIYDGVIERFKTMNLATIRFPGGSLSEKYKWWEGIGPKSSRPIGINAYTGGPTTNNYGIDEHYDFCSAIGAIPTITVNFGNGTSLEAANWVEYCNGEIPDPVTQPWTTDSFKGNETADPGYFAWLRGQYGHPEPYNIQNWEVGNEVYNDWTDNYNATEYATRFIVYYDAMKAVDPTIKIAAVGYEEPKGIWNNSKRDTRAWNQEVARVAGAKMDALHIHTYGPVSEDGKTIFFWGNSEVTQTVNIPQAGDYEVWITAEGMNGVYGPYPSSLNNYANLSININGISQVNFSVVIGNPRLYNHTLHFPSAGDYQLGIEFYNDGLGKDIMMLNEVYLKNRTSEILVEYINQTVIYNAVMATANYRGEAVYNISKILETETGRDDIEIWVTEFNTLYNTIGFGIDQPQKFQSAVAMADMALQFAKNGAHIIQQWSSINDFYLDLMHEARTLGDSSLFHTLDVLIEGWGQYLINSSVMCPSFDLETQIGWIPPRKDMPFLDVLPTLNDDELSIILINKHPTQSLNVCIDVEGFTSKETASLKIVNASSISAMDFNLPSNYYNYTIGKVGQALKINNTHIISYPSYDNALPLEGTLEFWIKPEWDGDDGKEYPILSIGQTFQLIKHSGSAIAVALINDNWTEFKVVFGPCASWNAGEWHHIALAWEFDKELVLYLDGVKQTPETLKGFHFYFEHREPIRIGSSTFNRGSNVNASLDEFRMSRIARSEAQIINDYNDGLGGIPLTVDGNTTILFHFDNSIEDSEIDQQTLISEKIIPFQSSGGRISLPRCSISLLKLQKVQSPSIVLENGGGNGKKSKSETFILGYSITILICITVVTSAIILKKLKKIKPKKL